MADYSFLTTWLLAAPRERVWEVLEDPCCWPEWWRGVVAVKQLEPGDERRVGSRYEIEWRSRLPYSLSFEFRTERMDRPLEMEGSANGELEGRGHWRLFEQDGRCAVLYEWNVRTTRPWMNALGPLTRPAFAWNHDVVMRWGGEGLARRLGVALLAAG